MKANLEKTTVKDIAYLINAACLRAESGTSLEKLAGMLCASDQYKVYLEDGDRHLVGVIQAKQIAMKLLELSRQKEDAAEMLPAITYVLNAQCGQDLAEPPVAIQAGASLKQVLELMDQNHVREIAVVDAENRLIGTLVAKSILSHYLQARAEASL